MSLGQTIEKDYLEAFKNKEETKVSTLRMLKSALKNLAIEKKIDVLDESDVLIVIRKELKKRQEAINSFKAGGRNDLLDKEQAEADILIKYLPAMLSENELKDLINQVVGEDYNLGQAMKEVMAQTKGRADGQLVQKLVKEKLKL